jgi:aminopeptidase-like protein
MTRRRATTAAPVKDAFRYRELDWRRLTREAGDMFERLFPICRSLTGDGVRHTLQHLQSIAALDVAEVPSGTRCYDWEVPDEWNIREAYIATPAGERLIDFGRSNLHVVGYSVPVNVEMSFDELNPHLHTLPSLPNAIPYRTSYYRRDWGFCLTHEAYQRLDRGGRYRVVIDSTLAPGALTYAEARLPGRSGREFLVSTYCCHPSLANDNLSGVVLWTLLLRELQSRSTWHSYRFVIVPETIGAIAYLHRNQAAMRRVEAGLVVTTVAGPGAFGYKQSFLGDHLIDRAVQRTFAEVGVKPRAYPFDVNGSDERQYSSPHFRIPTATICKDKYYEYPAYHTSLDDLSFVRPENLIATLKLYLRTIENLEADRACRSTVPQCEPMLGKRGLYPQTGGSIRQTAADTTTAPAEREYAVYEGRIARGSELDAMRWLMFWGDGRTTVFEIAERTGLPVGQLVDVAGRLTEHGLLEPVAAAGRRGRRA